MWPLLDLLFPPRADEKALRETSCDEFLALAVPRLVPATRPASVALLPFDSPAVRSALHEAKYHGSERAFRYLGETLADYLHDMDLAFAKSITIVPVPLGKKRLKERGFNQVEEIAKRALRFKGSLTSRMTLDSKILVRVRETPTQVALARQARERNMRGAFGAAHPANPSSTYIIVDDVLTTGATLQAAIDALKFAGAEHIIPLALAH